MPLSRNAVPASLRKPVEQVRFSAALTAKPYLVSGLISKSAVKQDVAALKTRFVRLPQEPEDAKITGVTRSLNRRLLGLNLGGSLVRRVPGLTA